jgi:tetratricopeptide (TPR) repeat protein
MVHIHRSSLMEIPGLSLKEQLLWKLRAGLRLLSFVNPQYAEAGYRSICDQETALEELILSGKLSISKPYNVLNHDLTGRDQYITIYPDDAGRTWAGGFPEEVKEFETIEITAEAGGRSTRIADTVAAAARSLSERLGTEIGATVASLRRSPPVRIGDLSVLHSGARPAFLATLDADVSAALIEFLQSFFMTIFKGSTDRDTVGREPTSVDSNDKLTAYQADLLGKYRDFSARGAETGIILLFTKICRAAMPHSPFGKIEWVCGHPGCSHTWCQVQRERIVEESLSLGPLGMGLAQRNIMAYTLSNTISTWKLLDTIHEHNLGLAWIERAAGMLMREAEEQRETMEAAKSGEEFYSIHHQVTGTVQAALVGWEYLVDKGPEGQREEFKRARNACDEIRARSINALYTDFANAVDIGHLLKFRQRLLQVAEASITRGHELVHKWIFDETMFPGAWEDFLWGRTNKLTLSKLSCSSFMGRLIDVRDLLARALSRVFPTSDSPQFVSTNPSVHPAQGPSSSSRDALTRGNLLREQGRRLEAEKAYREAIRSSPQWENAHVNLAALLEEQGRPLEAEKAYREAIRINPKNPLAQYNLGILLQVAGRRIEAEEAYREAIRFNAPAHYNLGVLLQEQGRRAEAEEAYRKAIRLNPENASAHYNLDLLLAEQSPQGEAKQAFNEVHRNDPNLPPCGDL